MDSKGRVLTALSFNEPDQVPCGFYAIDNDTVQKIIGRPSFVRNKAKTKIALWEGRRAEVVESFISDTIELFHKLDDVVDIINLNTELYPLLPPSNQSIGDIPKKIGEGIWEDRTGKVFKYSKITEDITMVHDPRAEENQFSLADFPLEFNESDEDQSIYEAVDAIVEEFKDTKFILGPCPLAKELILLGGFEKGLEMMLLEPEIVARAVASAIAQAEAKQATWRQRGFDGVLLGEDFSHNQGPFLSLPLFRSFCFGQMVSNVRFAHNHAMPFFHHACGNNWMLLDSFIEAGVDCYQSVQQSAGMDLEKVKSYTYGDMAVWGGATR